MLTTVCGTKAGVFGCAAAQVRFWGVRLTRVAGAYIAARRWPLTLLFSGPLPPTLRIGLRRRRPLDHGLDGRVIERTGFSLFTVGVIAALAFVPVLARHDVAGHG